MSRTEFHPKRSRDMGSTGGKMWAEFQETHKVSLIFLKYSCTKFLENIVRGLVTDTRSDGKTDVTFTKGIILLLRNES